MEESSEQKDNGSVEQKKVESNSFVDTLNKKLLFGVIIAGCVTIAAMGLIVYYYNKNMEPHYAEIEAEQKARMKELLEM